MELLAPAGNFESLIAAVQNGANAVYLGFGGYNARRSAGNFSDEEFFRAVEYCHARGVGVHVTLNTLVKQDELQGFAQAATMAAKAGADAVIVQDFGAVRLIKEICPGLKVHMSTQAACCNSQGVAFAKAQGYDRVVLARECSLEEIKRCARQGVEIETFAHGALCVCFSGQCLFSSMVGGRSGNRGMCAQPCRLKYELNGNFSAQGCLLSPKDIMMLDDLPALKAAGVASLKIEGRLKRPEYVAEVTRAYRRALDMLEQSPDRFTPDENDRLNLKQIFNRGGFSRAYLDEDFRDADITDISRPNNMGVRIGSVMAARGGRLRLKLDVPIDAGDQISLRAGDAETGFEAAQHSDKGAAEIFVPELKINGVDLTGAEVYRAASSEQLKRAKQSCEGEHRAVLVNMAAKLSVGKCAELEITAAVDKNAAAYADIATISARAYGAEVSPARKMPLTAENVRAQLAKTGGTALEVSDIQLELGENAFMPVSALNELRREAVDNFTNQLLEIRRGCPIPPENIRAEISAKACDDAQSHILVVQSRDLNDAALADEFYWEPEYIDAASLEREFDAKANGAKNIYLRLPNMLNSAELDEMLAFVRKNAAKLAGCVVANPAQLAEKLPGKTISDMNIPAWNTLALNFLRECGVRRITAPLELTVGEIKAAALGGSGRELIIYGRAELMTLRHCPVNARNGLTHTQCHLCDGGRGQEGCTLIDRKRVNFPLRRYRGASGCYVHVLNSAPHDLIGRLNRLPDFEAVRLIFTGESAAERVRLASSAKSAIQALENGVSADIKPVDGATAGHYFRGVE